MSVCIPLCMSQLFSVTVPIIFLILCMKFFHKRKKCTEPIFRENSLSQNFGAIRPKMVQKLTLCHFPREKTSTILLIRCNMVKEVVIFRITKTHAQSETNQTLWQNLVSSSTVSFQPWQPTNCQPTVSHQLLKVLNITFRPYIGLLALSGGFKCTKCTLMYT